MWNQSKSSRPAASGLRRPHISQGRTTIYDEETGQMYTESQVRMPSRQHLDWIGELRTPTIATFSRSAGHGARKLLDIAVGATVKHLRELTADHFSMMPWSVANNIWEEIVKSRRESFHAWRVFAIAYPEDFARSSYRYYIHLKQPSLALPDYFRGVTCDQAHWMTCLRISPKETRVADLISLSSITNLALLDLSDGQVTIDRKVSAFDERVMRTWAELAEGEDIFSNLQVIMLGWQDHVSTWLFKYLHHFRSLQHIILTDCPLINQKNRKDWEPLARDQGWDARHAKRSAKSLRPVLNEPKFQLGSVSGLLYTSPRPVNDMEDAKIAEARVQRPVVECWLGMPKAWTHIVDDFPSTRTVFFDRVPRSLPRSSGAQKSDTSDPVKRMRDREQRSLGVRSPHPKRILKLRPGVRTNTAMRGASDLLAEFGQ